MPHAPKGQQSQATIDYQTGIAEFATALSKASFDGKVYTQQDVRIVLKAWNMMAKAAKDAKEAEWTANKAEFEAFMAKKKGGK